MCVYVHIDAKRVCVCVALGSIRYTSSPHFTVRFAFEFPSRKGRFASLLQITILFSHSSPYTYIPRISNALYYCIVRIRGRVRRNN